MISVGFLRRLRRVLWFFLLLFWFTLMLSHSGGLLRIGSIGTGGSGGLHDFGMDILCGIGFDFGSG